MTRYYLSKNYNGLNNAGNKAKTDIEEILSKLGYKNAGLPQTTYSNKIAGFFVTLAGVLKVLFTVSANDVVVVQYPFKKYYSFVCNIIHLKRGKVITIIHDLGTFRRKKLTAEQEIKRLSHSDVLIVHNNKMKEWLKEQGYTKPMVCLEIFDYLSPSVNNNTLEPDQQPIKVIYAGALTYKKNRYLYSLSDVMSKWQFELYGGGFEENKIADKTLFKFKGFHAFGPVNRTSQRPLWLNMGRRLYPYLLGRFRDIPEDKQPAQGFFIHTLQSSHNNMERSSIGLICCRKQNRCVY